MTAPNHLALQIADAVVAAINGATLSAPVTAARAYIVRYDLAQLRDTRVNVVPVSLEETRIDRHATRRFVSIDVAIQRRLASDDPAAADSLVDLADEIAELLRFKPLGSVARNTAIEHHLYSVDDMEKHRVLKTLLRLTFAAAGSV